MQFYEKEMLSLSLSSRYISTHICYRWVLVFTYVTHQLMSPCFVLLCFASLPQPHTLLSLVSVQLAQGNVTGALALFRHILATALSSSSSFSSFAGCEQCRTSLPLLRCLQFYPFLYNLSHRQPCPRKWIKHTSRLVLLHFFILLTFFP